MPDGQGAVGWVLAATGAVVSALATSVAYLFRLREAEIRERISALEAHAALQEDAIVECRNDRQQLSIQVAILRGELEHYVKNHQ